MGLYRLIGVWSGLDYRVDLGQGSSLAQLYTWYAPRLALCRIAPA